MNIRHGDMSLIGIDKLPAGLKASDTTVLMQGSGGNDHAFENGTFYPKASGDNIIGYFEAQKGCILKHYGHGNICSVCGYNKLVKIATACPQCGTDFVKEKKFRLANVASGAYETRRQNEQTHEGMRPVVD